MNFLKKLPVKNLKFERQKNLCVEIVQKFEIVNKVLFKSILKEIYFNEFTTFFFVDLQRYAEMMTLQSSLSPPIPHLSFFEEILKLTFRTKFK